MVLTPVTGTTNRFGPDGQPPWYGERLDLHHAIWTCFANARTDEEKQADWEQAQEPVFGPTFAAVTSATRPTTSAAITRNTRPPDDGGLTPPS